MRHPLSVNFLEYPLSDLMLYNRDNTESPEILIEFISCYCYSNSSSFIKRIYQIRIAVFNSTWNLILIQLYVQICLVIGINSLCGSWNIHLIRLLIQRCLII